MNDFRHKIRRGLAVFLALVMCMSLMQVTAFAGDEDNTEVLKTTSEGEPSGEEGNTTGGENSGEEDNTSEDVNSNEENNTSEDENTEKTDSEEPTIEWDANNNTLTIIGAEALTWDTVKKYLPSLNVSANDVKVLQLNSIGTIPAYGFSQVNNLESVIINGADSIGDHAFFKNNNLEKVSVTNVQTICDNGFSECDSLVSVSLDSIISIGAEAFRHDDSLSDLKISNVGTFERSPFSYCVGLTTLELDGSTIDTLGVTMFYDCTSLTSVTLKNFDAIPIQMFNGCTSLKTVTMENIGTIGSGVFMNCTQTEGDAGIILTLTNVDTIGASAFSGCAALKDVTMTNVESIGASSFASCKALETVTMIGVRAIGEQAFISCYGLKTVTMTDVESIGINSFASCKALETISIPDSVTTIDKYAFYKCTGLNNVIIGAVGTIGQYAFQNCSSLKSITMGAVDTIAQYAFWNCSSLETIDSLSNVKTSIGGFAFYGCSSLKGLTVDDLTKMGYIGKGDTVDPDIMKRVEAILSGKFQLDDATTITALSRDTNTYPAGAIDQSENWRDYDNGTQLMEQARWLDSSTGTAEVKVDAYYTGEQQMDYIFVADLSASMAQLGNPEDANARFYDMQSKLLDMTDKLLSTPGYDCKVAIVTFGGFHNNNSTKESSSFMDNAEDARTYILGLEPLNENTDYKLGLDETLEVLKTTSGRNTSVIFLSDGQPTRDGEAKIDNATEYNVAIAALANQIKDQNVNIYGVLHSPASSAHEAAMIAMNAVCGEGNVYESTDTESFGKAMNAAFTAAYGDNNVTIPVNAAEFDLSGLSATAGEPVYNEESGTITWTLNGMPFTDHSLTYNLTLKSDLANRYGTYSYTINNGDATFGENAASVGLELTLSRTLSAPTASVSITPSVTSLTGGGTVTLTVNGPQGTTVSVDPSVTLTDNGDGTYTVTLPNSTQNYTFTASFPGNDEYSASSASCTVAVTYQSTGGGGTGGGGGGGTPTNPNPPTTITDPDVPLAGAPGLNSVDHFAYLAGYPDGTVRPTKNITRAEAATIFLRLMTEDFRVANWSTTHSFTDADAGEWFNTALSVSAKADILRGYSDGTVKPNAAITRAEFATIAARFLGEDATDEGVGDFSDTGSHWAAKDIRRAAKAGWIKGDGNSFRPDDSITRAEVVTIVNRMLDRIPDAEQMLPDMKTWSDNPVGAWYYADVQEASNDHAYERGEDGVTEHWTELTAPMDWNALEAAWIANNGASAPKTDGE